MHTACGFCLLTHLIATLGLFSSVVCCRQMEEASSAEENSLGDSLDAAPPVAKKLREATH